jgi:hypothetical protein
MGGLNPLRGPSAAQRGANVSVLRDGWSRNGRTTESAQDEKSGLVECLELAARRLEPWRFIAEAVRSDEVLRADTRVEPFPFFLCVGPQFDYRAEH